MCAGLLHDTAYGGAPHGVVWWLSMLHGPRPVCCVQPAQASPRLEGSDYLPDALRDVSVDIDPDGLH